ncbi:MAG: GspB domain-containing protein [Glaciimonas sp.]|nr:GspB domain-containing protein [Glaciimonas sp.]
MSYILDALKKAEAQRTLGALPNIHAQAVFAATSEGRAPLWLRAGRWGALTAMVMILIALAWFRPWQRGTVLPKAAPSAPAQSVAPAASIAPALPPPVRAVPAPPVPSPPKSTPKAVPPEASKPKAAASSMPTSLPKQPPAVAVTPPAKKPAPAPSASAAEPELQTLRDLPPQIQREIPPLVISGYIYSSNQAERSLLINNQLLREGDTVAPGLILEKMLRGAVVLNYQGYRYRMPY